MSANDFNLVPTHYQAGYIHWDLVLDTGMGYLEGNATKYISRWRRKNGIEDLKKALHYVNKLLEWMGDDRRKTGNRGRDTLHRQVDLFARANGLSETEGHVTWLLVSWVSSSDVIKARNLILELMEQADRAHAPNMAVDAYSEPADHARPVPLEDSNKHAERAKKGEGDGW